MFYAAILGRRPTLDPDAPDVLPHLEETEPPARGWAGDVGRTVREELGRALHLKLRRRPSWKELMEAVTRQRRPPPRRRPPPPRQRPRQGGLNRPLCESPRRVYRVGHAHRPFVAPTQARRHRPVPGPPLPGRTRRRRQGKARRATLGPETSTRSRELAETYVRHKPETPLPGDIEPPIVLPRAADAGREKLYDDALERGNELLDDGRIGAFPRRRRTGHAPRLRRPQGRVPRHARAGQAAVPGLRRAAFGGEQPARQADPVVRDDQRGQRRGHAQLLREARLLRLPAGGRFLLRAGDDAGVRHGRKDAAGGKGLAGPQRRRPRRQPQGHRQDRRAGRHEAARHQALELLPGRQTRSSA